MPKTKYELPSLPYDYDALEPYIDEETLHYHHDKHHQAYTDKFNMALEKYPELYDKDLEELLRDPEAIPESIRLAVLNNGGGYLNHNLYWDSLTPNPDPMPMGILIETINTEFGSFEKMKEMLTNASINQFGSGYGWLAKNPSGKLVIYGLPNQDSPLSIGDTPLLLIDVWEHAYYLKYKNMRPAYIANIWNIINWDVVTKRFKE